MRFYITLFFTLLVVIGLSQNPVTTSMLTTPVVRLQAGTQTVTAQLRNISGHIYWGGVRLDTIYDGFWSDNGTSIYNNNPGGVAIGTQTATTNLTLSGNLNYLPVIVDSSDIDDGISVSEMSRVIIYDDTSSSWYDWAFGTGAQLAAGQEGQLITLVSMSSGKLYLRNNEPTNTIAFTMFGWDNITIKYTNNTWVEVARTDFPPYDINWVGPPQGGVTYVGAVGLNGIQVTGSPITGIGTLFIRNIAIDSTVVSAGNGIRVDSAGNKYTVVNISIDSTEIVAGEGIMIQQVGNTYTIIGYDTIHGLNRVMSIDSSSVHMLRIYNQINSIISNPVTNIANYMAYNTTYTPSFVGFRGNGKVLKDQQIFGIYGSGHNGSKIIPYRIDTTMIDGEIVRTDTAYQSANRMCGVVGVASQDWDSVSNGTYLKFNTSADDSTTTRERMRLDQNGNLLIGQTSGDAQLSVSKDVHLYAPGSTATYTSIYVKDESTGKLMEANKTTLVPDSTNWEYEASNDDENNWPLPFTIKSNSILLYNGTPLRRNQWGGFGSAILVVNVPVKKYDHLILIN